MDRNEAMTTVGLKYPSGLRYGQIATSILLIHCSGESQFPVFQSLEALKEAVIPCPHSTKGPFRGPAFIF